LDAFRSEAHSCLAALQRGLARHHGVTILNSTRAWIQSGGVQVLNVPFAFPDFAARRTAWSIQIKRMGLAEDPELSSKLASGFVLTYDQIASASGEAQLRRRWRPSEPLDRELLSAARAQAGHDLAALARKVEAVSRWEDIVLPADVEDQLHEISSRAQLRYQVLEDWGFSSKLSQVNGVTVLFTGPSGAGKTMAAEVLANDLNLDLYKIDLSGVVSKYIGETEKNLERIFLAAERSNAILFFDEADALFGKRSEVRDAHDRYANIEVSYLLQRMEQYEGIAILATNLRGNLDEAFVRRIDFTVRFPLPGEAERMGIWEKIWPAKDLLAPGVELFRVAQAFKLSGGNIRNVALAASFFAAARGAGNRVTEEDILRGVQREYEKVGKTATLAELRAAVAKDVAA
jgi:SpoVK/Ycf46/Vps4 family AAA+-type ATPase